MLKVRAVSCTLILTLVMALALSSTLLSVQRAWADSVIANIPVGMLPFTVLVNPNSGNVYVPNRISNTVSVISTNNHVIATVPVGVNPGAIAFNPYNGNVYVSNPGNGNPGNANTVSVISGSTNQVIATIPVGIPTIGGAFIIAVNPNSGNVYVINAQTNTVSVISPSNQVIATIPVGDTPQDVAVNPNTGNVYVANILSNTVSVISGSTNQVIATVPVGTVPQKLAVNPNTGNVYVTSICDTCDTVYVISTTAITPTQALQNLINTIDSLHLPKDVTTSLEAPLNAAITQLGHNNNIAACNQLNAFLNQVNAKQTNGQLTPQQAAELTQQAKAIQQSIGCSNIGGMLGQTSPSLLPLPMP